MHGDKYQFEDKLITLIDEEMNLHFQEAYDPVLVPDIRKPFDSLGKGYLLSPVGTEGWAAEYEGKYDGQYLLLYPDQKIKLVSYYLGGLLHGPSTFYGETGVVVSQSWYIKGKQQGKCFQYYGNGEVYSIQRFFDGLWHGKQEFFYSNGKPKTILNYVYGKLEGKPVLLAP